MNDEAEREALALLKRIDQRLKLIAEILVTLVGLTIAFLVGRETHRGYGNIAAASAFICVVASIWYSTKRYLDG